MAKSRRKILIHMAQRAALTLAVLDLALYFAAVRPLDNLALTEWQRLNAARHRIQEIEANVSRLEKTRAALPGASEQLGSFMKKHVPPRRKGFSRADRLVQRLAQQAGLQLSDFHYRLDSPEGEPFERLGIDLGVIGSFGKLLKFVHAVETASDFILVRGFTFTPTEGGPLELHLNADLYLSP